MKTTCLVRCFVLGGAVSCASIAGAQNQTWIRQLGTSNNETSRSAAPDGSGGVYVGDWTFGSLGGPNAGAADVWLAHYDSAGNQTWIRQFGTSNDDALLSAAPDGSGGVYVGGETDGSLGGPNAGNGDAWLARYDSAGNQTWIRQFGTGDGDGVQAAAPDGSGGVYVGGYTAGSLGGPNAGFSDAWLARYDGAGNQTWIRQLGTSNNDYAYAAAPDGSGGVYVGGWTRGSLGGPNAGDWDAWLAHYDSAGNQTWVRQLGTSNSDHAYAAAPDGSGGVYVGGWTRGSLGGPNAGDWDAWLAHYDSAGNQTWIRQLGTSNSDYAYAAAPDGSGGVYVGGWTRGSLGGPNAGDWDAWLAHYDSAGNQTWIRQFGTTASEGVNAAAPDGSGGVYVGGGTSGSFGGPNAGGNDAWLALIELTLVETRYCTPSVPNSTGQSGQLDASGRSAVQFNDLEITASRLPQNSFGYFLASQTQGFAPAAGGSEGDLCLGGAIGRFVGPGQVLNSGAAGMFSLTVDLTQMPTPTGFVTVMPGETWNFQAWHRDANPTTTSNFTDAVSVTFL